jgi:hypothetical protein
MPCVQDEIILTTERKGAPGKLTFSVIPDEKLNITEGNSVSLIVDGVKMFYGYIFTTKRTKDKSITLTVYDQIRYLKSKDTCSYINKTASDFIKTLIADYKLKPGTIENTQFIIASRVEDNTALIDMVQNALDQELTNKKAMFVFYDDFGALSLKSLNSLKLGLVIDEETGENFDYTSTIDSQTYNQIKLVYDNESSGKRETYVAKDSSNIAKWGLLQYFDTLSKGENGASKADALLGLYNTKTRNLKIPGALGHTSVRAGSMLIVNLNLGDVKVQNYMLVEQCKHSFKQNEHRMDLTLRGGEFIA